LPAPRCPTKRPGCAIPMRNDLVYLCLTDGVSTNSPLAKAREYSSKVRRFDSCQTSGAFMISPILASVFSRFEFESMPTVSRRQKCAPAVFVAPRIDQLLIVIQTSKYFWPHRLFWRRNRLNAFGGMIAIALPNARIGGKRLDPFGKPFCFGFIVGERRAKLAHFLFQ